MLNEKEIIDEPFLRNNGFILGIPQGSMAK
jgi:hypothetical protein